MRGTGWPRAVLGLRRGARLFKVIIRWKALGSGGGRSLMVLRVPSVWATCRPTAISFSRVEAGGCPLPVFLFLPLHPVFPRVRPPPPALQPPPGPPHTFPAALRDSHPHWVQPAHLSSQFPSSDTTVCCLREPSPSRSFLSSCCLHRNLGLLNTHHVPATVLKRFMDISLSS